MKQKLFLVRRERYKFFGPMNLKSLFDAMSRMEIGVQDEVIGSCGPWVVMEQREKLKSQYPDVDKMISSLKPLGPISSVSPKTLKNKKLKPARGVSKPSPDVVVSRSPMPVIAVIASILLLCAAIYYVNDTGLFAKLRNEFPPAQIQELQTLSIKEDPSEFLKVFESRVTIYVDKAQKSRESFQLLLPYFRMYAFLTTGDISGLQVKLLRGAGSTPSAPECTAQQFGKRWDEYNGGAYSFTSGNFLPKNIWTKILLWDAHWIKRRAWRGWIRPKNYFEGCLIVALKTLEQIPKSKDTAGIRSMAIDRLRAQLATISGAEVTNSNSDLTHFWPVLTCQETAATIADLQRCRATLHDPDYRRLAEEHASYQLIRLTAKMQNAKSDELLWKELVVSADKMTPESTVGRLDYDIEKNFLVSVTTGDGTVDRGRFENAEFKLK